MIDNININPPQIKSLDDYSLEHGSLYENLTEQDERYFEDYLRYTSCSKCGKDHRFKPGIKDVQTSIDHASELIALFFNEGSH
jgi:hypothetical protein